MSQGIVGAIVGAVLAAPAALMLGAVLASGSRADDQAEAYAAGYQHGLRQRGVVLDDGDGDELAASAEALPLRPRDAAKHGDPRW